MNGDGPRVLCVDDEPRVLQGLESTLSWEFDVRLASSGAEGLQSVEREGPFAVVISDMRMPEMDGATFLAKVRQIAPNTTRMLLTGYSSMEAAIAAVNKGEIFQFLNKPCGPEVLLPAVQAAAERYRLVHAEQDLLEKTLSGSTQVLIDVLSLAAPTAFSRAAVLRGYVGHIVGKLGLEDRWRYEMAAMLSQIGCITLPPDTLDRVYANQDLSEVERHMFEAHPTVGRDLLAHVPRLKLISEMIARQNDALGAISIPPSTREEIVVVGAALIRFALDVDREVASAGSLGRALGLMRRAEKAPRPEFVEALLDYHPEEHGEVVRGVGVNDLRSYMVLDDDVRTKAGSVIVPRGHEVNRALIGRLKNFAAGVGLVEPIRVRIPARS